MHPHHSPPCSLFSSTPTTDWEVRDVSPAGVRIKVKVVPHAASAAEDAEASRRRPAAPPPPPHGTSGSAARRRAEARPPPSPSSSTEAVQDHADQDPITARVLSTQTPARPSVALSQCAKQRPSHFASSERENLPTSQHTTFAIAQCDEELLGHEGGCLCTNESRIDGTQDLDAAVFGTLGNECLKVGKGDTDLEEVFSLINALMPKKVE